VQVLVSPVGRHLPPAGALVESRADRLQDHLAGLHPEGEDESDVAVVGEEPVDTRPERTGEGDEEGLVARTRDLEVHAALLVERHLALVHGPGEEHRPQVVDELTMRDTPVGPGIDQIGPLRHPTTLPTPDTTRWQTPPPPGTARWRRMVERGREEHLCPQAYSQTSSVPTVSS